MTPEESGTCPICRLTAIFPGLTRFLCIRYPTNFCKLLYLRIHPGLNISARDEKPEIFTSVTRVPVETLFLGFWLIGPKYWWKMSMWKGCGMAGAAGWCPFAFHPESRPLCRKWFEGPPIKVESQSSNNPCFEFLLLFSAHIFYNYVSLESWDVGRKWFEEVGRRRRPSPPHSPPHRAHALHGAARSCC